MANGDPEQETKLDQILEVLLKLGAGDLAARVPLSGNDAPLDLVAVGINMVAEELAASLQAESEMRERLEKEVEARTLELKHELEARKRALELVDRHADAIRELSTPAIQVIEGILVLPLIGTVDTARGQQIMEQLLGSIARTQASVAIIDITGVPVIDTAVAAHLLKAVQASKLLGANTVLTGVSAHNAQTLVHLGVDLREVTTKGSLEAGLSAALAWTGRRIVQHEHTDTKE